MGFFCKRIVDGHSLASASVGIEYGILSVVSENIAMSRRVLELGFLPGEQIKIIKKSVLGKTFLVEICGYIISVRESVAKMIIVEENK